MTYNRQAIVDQEDKDMLRSAVLIGCVIVGVGSSLAAASAGPLILVTAFVFLINPIIK